MQYLFSASHGTDNADSLNATTLHVTRFHKRSQYFKSIDRKNKIELCSNINDKISYVLDDIFLYSELNGLSNKQACQFSKFSQIKNLVNKHKFRFTNTAEGKVASW